jgi:hypothetical protein
MSRSFIDLPKSDLEGPWTGEGFEEYQVVKVQNLERSTFFMQKARMHKRHQS